MKKFTNHTLGTRGIRTEDGMVWLDPGKSVEIDPKKIVGDVPDLGKPSDPAPTDGEDADLIAAVQAENDELKKQVEAQATELTALKAELEKLKKPAKPA